jgi:hypothetical protein
MRGNSVKNALLIRAAGLVWLATLAACGHSGNGPATVGVGIGVALTAPSGTTLVAEGGTIEIDATVSGDAANAGVNWTINPPCVPTTACPNTTTKFTYQAPTGVVGAVFATLTATSVTDPTKFSSVTLTVNGTPTILTPVLFPANQNIAYTTYISAAGGGAPYTWSWAAATGSSLPPGIALSGSTTAAEAITGTPTTLGSYSLTMTVTDAAGLTASIPLTLAVNPQTACLLLGPYAYLATGFWNQSPAVRAGSFNVSTTGAVTGILDYKDSTHERPATLLTGGTCLTATQNRGQLQVNSATFGNEHFDFATVASLKAGHLQQDDGTGVIEAGQFFQQDPNAFNLAALQGDWVFGVAGDDGASKRLVVVGRLTLDASGAISAAVADNNNNAATPVVAGAVTGTLAAPDSNGRGTVLLSVGGQPLPLAFYVVDQNTVFLVSNDTTATTPRVAGRMKRQIGAGVLDVTAFTQPAILSMWGSSIVAGVPAATMTAGRLSGATGGTIGVELDVSDRGTQTVNQLYTAQPYSVAANGRGTLAVGSGATVRNFVLYADGAGGGFVVEPASAVGNFGILEAQATGPFSDFTTAYYIGGTLFPGATSPITLAPQLLFQSGSISGNLTGNYALDPVTGRMVAAVSRTILGGSDLVIYIVSQNKLVILGDNLNIANSQLAWFEAY